MLRQIQRLQGTASHYATKYIPIIRQFSKIVIDKIAINCDIFVAAPATIIRQPQNRAVDVLKNVSLTCTAVGKPQPTITWKKSDQTAIDFTDGRVKLLDDGTLFIRGPNSVMFRHSNRSDNTIAMLFNELIPDCQILLKFCSFFAIRCCIVDAKFC